MIARRRTLSALVHVGFEILVTLAAFSAAVWIRSEMRDGFRKDFVPADHWKMLPVVVLAFAPFLWAWGFHRAGRTTRRVIECWKVLRAVAAGSVVLWIVASAILQQFEFSRAVMAIFVGLDLSALTACRMVTLSISRHQRMRGHDLLHVIVAGTGKAARGHVARLRERLEWGIEVVGMVSEAPRLAVDQVAGVPMLGSLADLPSLLRERVVDEVHFAVSRKTLERIDEPVRVCDEMGITVRIVANLLEGLNSRLTLARLEGTPLLTLSSTPEREAALVAKRAFDVAVSASLLVSLSPILAVAAFFIKLTSPGPVIFRQKRSGMNGRTFMLYKFRTMVADAEALRGQLENRNEMDGPVFKIKDDPRITKVGRILRKTSIDELPQLWNVLRGDMSIVGPRPPIPEEVDKYERWQRRRLSMRPGITCIWQVSGRNNIDFRRWMEMDLEYIDGWSLVLDIKILLKTIPAVLSSRGAS